MNLFTKQEETDLENELMVAVTYSKCCTFLHHNPVSADQLYCTQAQGNAMGKKYQKLAK